MRENPINTAAGRSRKSRQELERPKHGRTLPVQDQHGRLKTPALKDAVRRGWGGDEVQEQKLSLQ